ncbi:MAG: hypothetical protein OSJ70_07560 [Bacilli bacterium]|nr:hypothetical protein [Bacilli bacterium]
MKKVILSLLIVVFLTGCVSIQNASIDELVDTTINSKYALYNHVNRGFKYYLPRELEVSKSDKYNEIIKSKYYDYYLYVDLVRYFNKDSEDYQEKEGIFYSTILSNKDKKGILNITELANQEYLIEASFNYANIEVKVKEKDINEAVTNALSILTSIEFNYDVVKNLLQDDKMNSKEEQVDVFKGDLSEDAYLDIEEEIYTDDENKDPDMIN